MILIFRLFWDFKGRQALYTPPQVVDQEFKVKPFPLAVIRNHSYHPGFTTPGYMGLIVSLGKKKLKILMKLRPSVIAHFVGIVSGNKKHMHDFFVSCVFRAVEAVKVGKKCKKKS